MSTIWLILSITVLVILICFCVDLVKKLLAPMDEDEDHYKRYR